MIMSSSSGEIQDNQITGHCSDSCTAGNTPGGNCTPQNGSHDNCTSEEIWCQSSTSENEYSEYQISATKQEFLDFWKDYFDLETNYRDVRKMIDDSDPYLKHAAEQGAGIRILRQDPFEMIVTFIISQRRNIPSIKAAVKKLCEVAGKPVYDTDGDFSTRNSKLACESCAPRAGCRSAASSSLMCTSQRSEYLNAGLIPAAETDMLLTAYRGGSYPTLRKMPEPNTEASELTDCGETEQYPRESTIETSELLHCGEIKPYFTFPSPSEMSAMSDEDWSSLKLGYREKYLRRLAADFTGGEYDLSEMQHMDDDSLRNCLMSIYGVGRKIADCVLLFGFHRLDAFPVDVWVERVLKTEYPLGFDHEKYSPYNGIMQQYLYFSSRENARLKQSGEGPGAGKIR